MAEVIDAPTGELAALAATAEALEQAAAPPTPGTPGAPEAATPEQLADELYDALVMLRMMAAPLMAWWSDFAKVWSDQALQGIAAGGAAVMHKHGWTTAGLFAEIGPYVALVAAMLPPSLITWMAIKARREAPRERPQQTAH